MYDYKITFRKDTAKVYLPDGSVYTIRGDNVDKLVNAFYNAIERGTLAIVKSFIHTIYIKRV